MILYLMIPTVDNVEKRLKENLSGYINIDTLLTHPTQMLKVLCFDQ